MLFYIISYSSYKENLSNNQELLEFVVISFVLLYVWFRVKLLGEMRCLSLLGVKLRRGVGPNPTLIWNYEEYNFWNCFSMLLICRKWVNQLCSSSPNFISWSFQESLVVLIHTPPGLRNHYRNTMTLNRAVPLTLKCNIKHTYHKATQKGRKYCHANHEPTKKGKNIASM